MSYSALNPQFTFVNYTRERSILLSFAIAVSKPGFLLHENTLIFVLTMLFVGIRRYLERKPEKNRTKDSRDTSYEELAIKKCGAIDFRSVRSARKRRSLRARALLSKWCANLAGLRTEGERPEERKKKSLRPNKPTTLAKTHNLPPETNKVQNILGSRPQKKDTTLHRISSRVCMVIANYNEASVLTKRRPPPRAPWFARNPRGLELPREEF